ncbi:carbohydrate binding domain-containing protein [Streptomyces europaeiscabiei]|uniref:carbohydrate binding domain-containing protein n=1 Tax=Streptomyces europaeiscabiei TaxID=146819 RepID=UPI0029B21A89|nr:carbohydrate binding domain-containing protein [Streptomyces europaeiscabiei]MDX3585876.1 Tat pathway signal protein [Streptomyces europaeiscabiei]
MAEALQRRSLLKMAAGTAAAGWLWQGGTALAADTTTAATATGGTASRALDTLVLGDTVSESAHGLTATLSDVVAGGLDQTARVLTAPRTAGFWGGVLSARMACRPRGATYVTVKLWGSESGAELGRLQLFAEGKQVGHYHLGAVDPLDIASEDPRSPERFFFHTLPLPLGLTEGKKSISLEIRSMGRISGYGATADAYYKAMEGPSRTIYRLYTHDVPYFDPAHDDITGTVPAAATRTSPGTAIIGTINDRILARAASEASRTSAQLDLWYLEFLARAYGMPATAAYRNIAVPPQIARSLDGVYWKYLADPTVMTGSSQQWMGLGRAGLVVLALADDLEPLLDEPVLGSPHGLTNPGFEFGTTGWTPSTWSGRGTASRDTTVHRTGHASAKVTIPGAGTVGYSTSAKIPVDRGTYTYGAWIRTDGVGTDSAYLDILFHDANGALVGTDNKVHASAGTHDWEQVTASLTTPATATQVTIGVRLSGTGTAWFDDLTMTGPDGSSYTPVVRRDAWAKMLLDSREYWRQHIPQYTNQAIICAIGLYLADRGLSLLGSGKAWGEEKARDHIYQSVGLVPWLGPEDEDGTPTRPLGGSYHQVTRKGISKELGYAGSYGELQEWLSLVYDAVTGIGGVEDGTLRDHLVKMAKARMVFRHPSLDRDGYRAMRLETMIGWRDTEYPGKVAYDEDTKWDGHALKMAALIKDPDLTSYARQSLADGQAFQSLADSHAMTVSARTNLNLVTAADDYAYVSAATGSGAKLPMTPGAPDFVFSDEENGLLAVKHGDEILYASLYWRARWGVNRLARVHHISAAGVERSATVWQDVKYVADGRAFSEPDWVNWEFTVGDLDIPDGGFDPPGDTLRQAFAGQVLPLAKAPDDMPERAVGVETPYAGRASFYRCEYGPYLIAMNTTDDRHFTLGTKGFGASTNLVTGARVGGNATLRVKPGTTVVLRRR